LKEKAYAKINLHLAVTEKRADGYHNIESVMASVSLCDEIKVLVCEKRKTENSELEIEAYGRFGSVIQDLPLEKNLVYKAFILFFENVSYNVYMKIRLNKRIPAGAGLAGGSSDAAAMLRLLNRIFHCYSFKKLMMMGSKIGADVPFCLQKKPAFCIGIGNIISVYNKLRLKIWVVITFNDCHISTKEAYQNLLSCNSNTEDCKKIKELIYLSEFRYYFNSFENYAIKLFSEIANIKKFMYDYGAFFSLMTGSGSSVVGYFKSKQTACKAAGFMNEKGFDSVVSYLI